VALDWCRIYTNRKLSLIDGVLFTYFKVNYMADVHVHGWGGA